jgi:hypothetical protein
VAPTRTRNRDSRRLDIDHERNPSQAARRHQFDNGIHCTEPRSVYFTAAAGDNSFLQAVDATAASLTRGEVASVFGPMRLSANLSGLAGRVFEQTRKLPGRGALSLMRQHPSEVNLPPRAWQFSS